MTLEEALWQDPGRMSGAICFRRTRVPVKTLFDHLLFDDLEGFREGFPDVSEEQIQAVIEASNEAVESMFTQRRAAA